MSTEDEVTAADRAVQKAHEASAAAHQKASDEQHEVAKKEARAAEHSN